MNHYFRLLFVSFALFLLLGLNERHSADSGSSRPSTMSLSYQACHDGILPTEERIASELVLPALFSHKSIQCCDSNEQGITHSSAQQSRYIFYTDAFLEYRPGIARKTGHLLHFQSHRGDPSLA